MTIRNEREKTSFSSPVSRNRERRIATHAVANNSLRSCWKEERIIVFLGCDRWRRKENGVNDDSGMYLERSPRKKKEKVLVFLKEISIGHRERVVSGRKIALRRHFWPFFSFVIAFWLFSCITIVEGGMFGVTHDPPFRSMSVKRPTELTN